MITNYTLIELILREICFFTAKVWKSGENKVNLYE